GIDPPSKNPPAFTRAAWNLGLLTRFLQASVERHPGWHVVSHERLVTDPLAGYRALCGDLGLGWTRAIEEFLEQSDRPGTGFETLRVAAQLTDRWRRVFSDAQAQEVTGVLSQFSLK